MQFRERLSGLDRLDESAQPSEPAPAGTSDAGGGWAETASVAEAGGSKAPPSSAGDESPNRAFPVPPVPPPPSPGPIFSLAGGGGGGPASFARPGTEAAKPFRSPIFTQNRSTAMPRFGAGTPVTAGATAPFMPAGLEGGGESAPPDELQRIMALIRGGGGGA